MSEIPLPFHPSITKPRLDSRHSRTCVRLRVRVLRRRCSSALRARPPAAVLGSTPGSGPPRLRMRILDSRRQRAWTATACLRWQPRPAASRGAAAPDPAGAVGMEPPPFLSEIFPEEHANLSWLPDGKIFLSLSRVWLVGTVALSS